MNAFSWQALFRISSGKIPGINTYRERPGAAPAMTYRTSPMHTDVQPRPATTDDPIAVFCHAGQDLLAQVMLGFRFPREPLSNYRHFPWCQQRGFSIVVPWGPVSKPKAVFCGQGIIGTASLGKYIGDMARRPVAHIRHFWFSCV